MSDPANSVLIGVDAGGSKTTAWVVQEQNWGDPVRPTGCGHAGPANVRTLGIESSFKEIRRSIDRALAEAGIFDRPRDSFKICVAAAGAGRRQERRQLHDVAAAHYPSASVLVTHDAQPILAAASTDQVGIALISGTGSFAWGRNLRGDEARSGGWGYLFGDEGSGYSIAIAALKAVTHAADGRGESTTLSEAVLEHLGISEPAELIERVYGRSLSRGELARLSELVFRHETDPVASEIIRNAADSLSLMVNSLAKRLELDGPKIALAFSGGLLIHQPLLRERVLERIDQSFENLHIVTDPVAGTIRLAASL